MLLSFLTPSFALTDIFRVSVSVYLNAVLHIPFAAVSSRIVQFSVH